MDKEIKDEIEVMAKLLGGQLRGAINKAARKENLELILITFRSIFMNGYEYGKKEITEQIQLERVRQELGIKDEEDEEDGNDNSTQETTEK